MSDIAIRVSNLAKQYRLGRRQSPETLREKLMRLSAAPFTRIKRACQRTVRPSPIGPLASDNWFWALKDVSFDVKKGDVVGIIGGNGAGKSTLLKILSRITEPTNGEISIHGHVASLLEVGTGFHPELTGRENIFLNGAVLGMKRAEIARKFDEIVDFAEIDTFLDTPVKHYSSGMYVRLAFAVAAHLEPDILVVDEVLSVGDAQFQKKCIGKMGKVAEGGRTVLFVSHNAAAVTRLCPLALWLSHGQLVAAGPTPRLIADYLQTTSPSKSGGVRNLTDVTRSGGDQTLRFTSIKLRCNDLNTDRIPIYDPFTIEIDFNVASLMQGEVGLIIKTPDGVSLVRSSTNDDGSLTTYYPGAYRYHCLINPNCFRPGPYTILVGSTCSYLRDLIDDAISFEIVETRPYCAGSFFNMPGYFHFDYHWSLINKTGTTDIAFPPVEQLNKLS